ncbi:hypothetical protein AVEN_122004-1 [Araneus ventricosus]|uniref:Uncharacterized protein n=1 Tax=Araneus ventricosus TaxID=182803 RepID=A0A4Y2J575_ARAVE|nr:hypothetical protein AVEN_122004-1 [Araneus ventricosus]
MQQKLFDICRYKCHDFDIYRCGKVDKVPKAERVFLNDQRSSRIIKIGSLDVKETRRLRKREQRCIDPESRSRNCPEKVGSTFDLLSNENHQTPEPARSLSAQSEERNDSSTETEVGSNGATSKSVVCQNRILYPKVAVECDRYGVSDRAAAAIVNAALQDSGQLKNGDLTLVVDRSKIRRERKRVRNELRCDSLIQINQNPVCGLYFDGRKDNTVVKIVNGEKYCRNIIKEEHITIVQEPKSKYIGHITVSNGEAITIAKGIIEFLKQNEQGLSNLTVIGCDGTNVNKGTLDGVTSGPRAFSGPIGIAIKTCEELAIVPFEAIEGTSLSEMGEFHIRDLSDDQRYLKEIFQAVSDGNCPNDLANRKQGTVVHSRWLTTASRILRLYVSKRNPSDNLVILVTYIMNVYTPVWFSIKMKFSITEGSRHFWKIMKYSRYMQQDDLRQMVDGVLQRKGFFAHEDNLILYWNEPMRKRYEPPITKMLPDTEIETIGKTRETPDTQLFPCEWCLAIHRERNAAFGLQQKLLEKYAA